MDFQGTVLQGTGEGARYVALYQSAFLRELGFEAFPGTLNLRVKPASRLPAGTPIAPPEAGLFPLACTEVIINGKVRGAVIRPQATRHPPEIVEVIAPLNLRDYFGLRDGDVVRVRIWGAAREGGQHGH
ncbi:MAG: CTP-dependent riboflavin kinase [Candidatus Aenigmarchaeota archaeon]|nr:CTP-dependent riboflavin kinase [Candidatus Aenigmarchaeota archaeon]